MDITIKELEPVIRRMRSIDLSVNDRLTYAVKKNMDLIDSATAPARKILETKNNENRINAAATDKDNGTFILSDKGDYTFTTKKFLELTSKNEDVNIAFDGTVITYTPFFAGPFVTPGDGWDRLPGLDLFLVEGLTGFLFPAATPDQSADPSPAAKAAMAKVVDPADPATVVQSASAGPTLTKAPFSVVQSGD